MNLKIDKPTAFQRVFRIMVTGALCLVLIALVVQALYHLLWIGHHLFRPWDNTISETDKVYRAYLVATGHSLHAFDGYGPLFCYPVAWVARLFDLSSMSLPEQAHVVFFVGRGFSALAALSILVWLFLMARLVGLRGIWQFVPTLLFFSGLRIIQFSYCYRADFPMVALCLWAWWVALRWGRTAAQTSPTDRSPLRFLRGPGTISALMAGMLMAQAFHYKPTALISAVPLFFWLLITRQKRRALMYGLTTAGMIWIIGSVMALLLVEQVPAIATAGVVADSTGTSWMQTSFWFLSSSASSLDWANLWLHPLRLVNFDTERPFAEIFPALVGLIPLVGGVAGGLWLWRRKESDGGNQESLHGVLFAFALVFILTNGTVLRIGSMLSYYIEAYCWGALVVGVAAQRGASRLLACDWRGRLPHPGWAALFLVVFALYAVRGERCREDLPEQLKRQSSPIDTNRALLDILNETTGEVILSEPYLFWHTKSPLPIMNWSSYCNSVSRGLLSTEPLEEKIRNLNFELIVYDRDIEDDPVVSQGVEFLPRPILEAIAEKYKLDSIQGPFHLYRPRTP